MSESVHNSANDNNGKGMNDSDRLHLPNAEFIARLESNVVDAYRRQSVSVPPSITTRRRRFQNAGILGVGLLLGIAAGIAPAQVQNAQQRNELSVAQDTKKMIAQIRLQLARARYESVKKSVDAGVSSSDALLQAQLDVKSAESEMARIALNVAEIDASATAPRDELWAPLVNGRDYVTERLKIDAIVAQQRLSNLQQSLTIVEQRVRAGAASEVTLIEAQQVIADSQRSLNTLVRSIDLRKSFLEKTLDQKAIIANVRINQVRDDVMRLTELLDLAQRRASVARKREAVGASGELEVKRAEVDVLERTLELEQLRLQLQAVLTAQKYRKD